MKRASRSAAAEQPDDSEQQANTAYLRRQMEFIERQQERAQQAYDAFSVPWPAADEFPAGSDFDFEQATRSKTAHRDMQQAALVEYLDADSLPFFCELIARDREALRKSEQARTAVEAKLAADPKQAAKKEVEDCWKLWQQQPSRYKDKSKFALDMLKKYEVLESQVVITRWCGAWEKAEAADQAKKRT